jgi:predicted CoA-binding protein
MNDQVNIPEILQQAKTIAVVGLSANRSRPSYGVAEYMQSQGYRIVPVNPKYSSILNERCYATLLDIPPSLEIDIVNIFRRSDAVLPIVEEAIQIGAKGVWMQEGVIHQAAAEKAKQAGLWVVMDRCLFKDHSHYVQKPF